MARNKRSIGACFALFGTLSVITVIGMGTVPLLANYATDRTLTLGPGQTGDLSEGLAIAPSHALPSERVQFAQKKGKGKQPCIKNPRLPGC